VVSESRPQQLRGCELASRVVLPPSGHFAHRPHLAPSPDRRYFSKIVLTGTIFCTLVILGKLCDGGFSCGVTVRSTDPVVIKMQKFDLGVLQMMEVLVLWWIETI
jgi:hypothetical protein